MLVGGDLIAVYLLVFIAFLFIGGLHLVAAVLAGQTKNDPLSTRIILGALLLGFPVGAIFGIRLWTKLMRKTGFIGDSRIKRMSGL